MAVLKLSSLPSFNRNTRYEQETLIELREQLDEPLRSTVPEPLGTFQYGNLFASIEPDVGREDQPPGRNPIEYWSAERVACMYKFQGLFDVCVGVVLFMHMRI